MQSRSSALMWRVVLASFLVIGAQSSFAPRVIQWKGLPAKRLFLSLSTLPNQATVSSNGVSPQKLTILDQPLRHKSSSNDIPYFTPRPDKTIAWGASDLCIEASGDRSGDAVVVNRCEGAPNQLWDFLPLSSGKQNQMQIRLKDTTACLYANNEGKEGVWNEAAVQLRECNEKMTESWEFEETMTFPMQDPSKLASSSNLQRASTTVISVAMLMIASLSVWLWRWRRSSMVPSRRNDTPSTADPGCVSLTVPVATRQGRVQSRVPAVMTLSTDEESDAPKETVMPESGKSEILDGQSVSEELDREATKLGTALAGYPVYLIGAGSRRAALGDFLATLIKGYRFYDVTELICETYQEIKGLAEPESIAEVVKAGNMTGRDDAQVSIADYLGGEILNQVSAYVQSVVTPWDGSVTSQSFGNMSRGIILHVDEPANPMWTDLPPETIKAWKVGHAKADLAVTIDADLALDDAALKIMTAMRKFIEDNPRKSVTWQAAEGDLQVRKALEDVDKKFLQADDGEDSVPAVMAVAAKLAKKKLPVAAKPTKKTLAVAAKPAKKKLTVAAKPTKKTLAVAAKPAKKKLTVAAKPAKNKLKPAKKELTVAAKPAKKKLAVAAKPAKKELTVAAKPAKKKAAISESDKLYTKRELPPVLGALAAGDKKLVVITGASSGLGLWCTKALTARGDYYVIAAVRDTAKMEQKAKEIGIPKETFRAMKLELASLQSVRDFVDNLKWFGRPPQSVICNAAVYRPTEPTPAWTDDGFEMSLGVNHLGHFLLAQLLLPELKKVDGAQLCVVGSVTGNSNTIAGSFVKPVAELGELEGLKAGGGKASRMPASPYEKFNGAKAYKDAKALNMMTVLELHRRFHKDTGIVFNSLYPGCIADTGLFREKRAWFRDLFPKAMRTIGAYVGEAEAGERLAQVIHDPACNKSGVYWSWNGNGKQFAPIASKERTPEGNLVYTFKEGAGGSGGDVFENEFAEMILDEEKGRLAYQYSMDAVSQYL